VDSILLRTVFALAHEMARTVGCLGVVVDAKPDAVSFYERLGFGRSETGPSRCPCIRT
jgi:hypothetical protein